MLKTLTILAAIVLILHGLIHLMGTAVYMKLATIEGLKYKTTLLGGRWELGESGIWVFGLLWIIPAIGFVGVGVALLTGWSWWQPVLMGATLFSLALTGLDWRNAFAGVVVNVAILAALWLWPRIVGWFPQ